MIQLTSPKLNLFVQIDIGNHKIIDNESFIGFHKFSVKLCTTKHFYALLDKLNKLDANRLIRRSDANGRKARASKRKRKIPSKKLNTC